MSITVTPTDIANVAPELASESAARVNIFIEIARQFICESKWGSAKGKNALIFLTAHLLTLANRNGNSGNVTSETVGDYSQSYGSLSGDQDPNLAQTSYGSMILMLGKTVYNSPIIVG